MLQKISGHKYHIHLCERDKRHFVTPAFFSLFGGMAIGLLIVFISITTIPSFASTDDFKRSLKDETSEPWHITADEIKYDAGAEEYIAEGKVMITKGDNKFTADFVRFAPKTMQIKARGHVIMTAGEDILTGDQLEMDLKEETGTIYKGSVFLKDNHFYIKGDKIQKVGKYTYAAEKATVTTCDGDVPAWKITGRNLNVTVEGYGFISHAALWAKKVPVLYVPFFVVPAKTKRQSGFLTPSFGDSDRKGLEYVQPFFWAISESSDATFYEHYMASRGNRLGAEFRYISDERSKGTLMFDFLNDRKVDDGTDDSSEKWGFEDDDFLRPNKDRYWFRMKADQNLPCDFSAKLDLDIVSDQDYLLEFKDSYAGFNETWRYFIETFGRNIDDYNDPVRTNRLNLNRTWSWYSVNAETRWYDDVIYRRQKELVEGETTPNSLPLIEFTSLRQPLLDSPFYFDLRSEYAYLYRERGTSGQRADLFPRFYLPCKYKNYFTFEPSLGLRETAWYIDKFDGFSGKDRTLNRNLYDVLLDLNTRVSKVYRKDGEKTKAIQHIARPQIFYEFIPDQDLERYPFFDSVDRVAKRNLLTYSITNMLTSKSEKNRTDASSDYDYHQFCRFKLEQSYDINEAKEDDPENFINQKTRNREPFSPVFGELDIALTHFLYLQADAEWSPYENNFPSRNIATSISDKRGDRLFVEHRRTTESLTLDPETSELTAHPSSESIYTDLTFRLTNSLLAFAEFERNIKENENIRSGLGFEYTAQCWSVGVSYTEEIDDQRIAFMVNLYGLGQLGERFPGRTIGSPLENY
jgi:LPS-assembly protein